MFIRIKILILQLSLSLVFFYWKKWNLIMHVSFLKCRYVFGITHVPRLEDWPVMPVERIGFMLQVHVGNPFINLIILLVWTVLVIDSAHMG